MRLKRVGAASAAAILVLLGAYAGFLGHRSRHAISLGVTGPYQVGRAFHELADRSRTDELAPLGGNPRVLSVTLWYPAASAGTPSTYAPGAWGGLHRFGWGQTSFNKINTGTALALQPQRGDTRCPRKPTPAHISTKGISSIRLILRHFRIVDVNRRLHSLTALARAGPYKFSS